MSDMKMYNILGAFNNVDPKMTPVAEETKAEPVYESVEPRGSIMEAVKSLEEKYMGFKKKLNEGMMDYPQPEEFKSEIDYYQACAYYYAEKADEAREQGDFELSDEYDSKSAEYQEKVEELYDLDEDANYEPAAPNPEAIAKRKHLQALKDKQEAERAERSYSKEGPRSIKGRAYGGAAQAEEPEIDEGEYDPAPVDPEAVAKRKRLQALKDKQEDEQGYGSAKSNVRSVKGKAYGGSAQFDAPEADDLDEVAPPGAKAERMVKHIKKGYAKDGKLTKREKAIAYATAWKAHNKGQVEEGVQFKDTIKNSQAKLTKAKPAKLKESRMLQEGDYFYETVGKAIAEKNPHLDTASSDFVAAVRQEMVAQGIPPNRARNIIMMDEDFLMDVASSYGHYVKELAECGVPMNSFVGGNMEELDEISRLAGLPVKEASCPSCGMKESACACSEEAITEAADQEKVINTPKGEIVLIQREYDLDVGPEQRTQIIAPLGMTAQEVQHYVNAEVYPSDEEDSSYQFFAMMPTFSEVDEGNAFTGKLASTPKGGEFELGGKSYKDTSGLEEEMEMEGNEFSGALAAAKAAGKKEFEVDGKKYTVKEAQEQVNEEIQNLTIQANGFDAVHILQALSGLTSAEEVAQPQAQPEVQPQPMGVDPQVGLEEEQERDIEYTNTPREEVAGLDAAIPSGTDLNRAKKQYKREYPGDNPMAVEESLWKSYEAMINSVKK